MIKSRITAICVAASLMITPIDEAAASDGLVGGIVGGIIGGAIVSGANKNRQPRRKTTTRSKPRSTMSSATRNANRETQTALNYFSFPAGTPDGVMGRNSRRAIADYQGHLGYPSTGQLTQYERDFLVTSYHRAIAGGATTQQLIATNPQGPRGLLTAYQQAAAGGAVPAAIPQPTAPAVMALVPDTAPATNAIPNFMGATAGRSLASHCNKVSLLTNTNGGFVTAANMVDANFALNEQFCLARTYAIAEGEELVAKVQGFSVAQIEQQCAAFGPAMVDHVSALSLQGKDDVLRGVSGFALASGMSPAQLAGTARICLSVGYRKDDMDVAIGSALLLVALGEPVYGELMGHHLSQGFGAAKRPDLALAWYDASLSAIEGGATAAFAPGQPERNDLLRKASYTIGGRTDLLPATTPVPAALPTFNLTPDAAVEPEQQASVSIGENVTIGAGVVIGNAPEPTSTPDPVVTADSSAAEVTPQVRPNAITALILPIRLTRLLINK